MDEVKTGEIFYAFNSDMVPRPKNKYHLCISQNKYFIINTDPPKVGCSFALKKEDCQILTRNCYINTTYPQIRDISTFEISQKAELSRESLENLIEHIKFHRSLTRITIKEIVAQLEKALLMENA